MAPHRKNAEENGSSTKDKTYSGVGAGVSKGKKATAGGGGSSLRDVTNAAHSSAATTAAATASNDSGNGANGQNVEALDFNALPRRALHAYRAAYNLHQPSSFRSFHNGIVLSVPGSIGLQSPTMLRPKEKRRIPKKNLAKAVRNHFMDQSVNELDVEARMMYNVKTIDKAFKMKFAPTNPAKK